MSKKPTVLLILDGYGLNDEVKGNAVAQAKTPVMDKLIQKAKEATGRVLTPCGSCQSDLSLFIKNGSERAFSFGIGRDFDFYGGAHQADEFIECEKLLEYTQIIAAVLL